VICYEKTQEYFVQLDWTPRPNHRRYKRFFSSFVARIERSEIRDMRFPDFAALNPGYKMRSTPSLRAKRSNPEPRRKTGLRRRGACHRARVRATRWLLAMTPKHTSAF
jgi:hypothetical protein